MLDLRCGCGCAELISISPGLEAMRDRVTKTVLGRGVSATGLCEKCWLEKFPTDGRYRGVAVLKKGSESV